MFKDGREVATIPGTDPEEPFTLNRYKEVSGFGYSQITLHLVPLVNKKLSDLQSVIQDSDLDSSSADDNLLNPSLHTAEEAAVSENRSGISSPPPTIAQPSTASSSSDMQSSTSASCIMKVQCPLCFLKFPINEVEQHADGCSASFGLLAENDVACDIPTFEDLGDESSIV